MITSINGLEIRNSKLSMVKNNNVAQTSKVSMPQNSGWSMAASNAVKNNGINMASTIRFTGALQGAFQELNQSMVTCKTKDNKGESVGSRANVNKLLHDFAGDFSMPNDAIKTTVEINQKEITKTDDSGKKSKVKVPVLARTQMKLLEKNAETDSQKLRFEMSVRDPEEDTAKLKQDIKLLQNVRIDLTPINYKGEGTHEQAYVLNTKGNLMAVVEDGNDVILTNAGKLTKKGGKDSLEIDAWSKGNKFDPFKNRPVQEVKERQQMPSIGKGTEIIIGMEDGRFVNEIKDSIRTFVQKVNDGEIVLQQFVAAPNASGTKLVMLAGGYGSRAEYTNASSSAIFHDKEGGAQSTKGVFRTATGLTPMETTFVTLHNAGLLDCSKGVVGFGEGGNIKFYLNKTGKNTGNGGFTIGLYNRMELDKDKAIMIFPNDSMSRMTKAVINAQRKIDSGEAAMVMVAKKVKASDAKGTFGIMKLDENNHILEFAEKPDPIPAGYEDNDHMCLTNTFQFAVSKEAFKALEILDPYLPDVAWGKESRDWSKVLTPVLMNLTMNDDVEKMQQGIYDSMKQVKEFKDKNLQLIPTTALAEAKAVLGKQRIFAEPTSEPWADCGTLNQLYHTTMQIASNDFPLEDFERAHVLECVDTQTGLVASSKDQKDRIAKKYDIDGEVMVVSQANVITDEDVAEIPVEYHV